MQGKKKDRKECKSAERKGIKKNQLQLLLYRNSQIESVGRDRSKAQSSLGHYNIDLKKHSMDLMLSSTQKRSRGNYEYSHVIGKGGFGKVYKVHDRKTGQSYAMKEMCKAVILAKKSTESVRNQRDLLTCLKHKFIVNMRHAFQDRDTLYLIMDLMPGGDLRYHICKKHRFTEEQTRFFAACIFTALQYLHSHNIIHRDLKPENLVLDAKGYLHVTDLGIAKALRQDNSGDTSGTPGYMAPEVMTKQNHSFEVDYYALGVILYELMLGKRPYVGKDRKQIREQILSRQVVVRKQDIPEGWSIQAADCINKLLQRRPMMRLGWSGPKEVKQHAWLRAFPWAELMRRELDSPFRAYSKYNPEVVRYHPTKEDDELNGMIRENKLLLRKSMVQELFEGYSFEEELKLESHTTSTQLYRKSLQGK